MASPAYEQIMQVQALDLRLTQLRHRHANHPLRAELAAAGQSVAEIEARTGAIDSRRHALDRDLKRLSDEVETIEAKRTEIEGKLYGGTITASKELLVLQDEAESFLQRQRGIEDQELEIMEQLEAVSEESDAARAELSAATATAERAELELAEATAEIDAEILATEQQRSEAARPALPELLARYEELSAEFGGVAVARFVEGRCDGCHMQLSAMAVDRLTKAPEDAVVTCEECGRLLVR